jgi:hypothetical protein
MIHPRYADAAALVPGDLGLLCYSVANFRHLGNCMSRRGLQTVCCSGFVLLSPLLTSLTLARSADGFFCTANGRVGDRYVYFLSSLIDATTLSGKQPVSLLILDSRQKFGLRPVAQGDLRRQPKDQTQYLGRDETGTVMGLKLAPGFGSALITYNGVRFQAACH